MSSSPSQPLAGRRIWIAGIGGAGMSGVRAPRARLGRRGRRLGPRRHAVPAPPRRHRGRDLARAAAAAGRLGGRTSRPRSRAAWRGVRAPTCSPSSSSLRRVDRRRRRARQDDDERDDRLLPRPARARSGVPDRRRRAAARRQRARGRRAGSSSRATSRTAPSARCGRRSPSCSTSTSTTTRRSARGPRSRRSSRSGSRDVPHVVRAEELEPVAARPRGAGRAQPAQRGRGARGARARRRRRAPTPRRVIVEFRGAGRRLEPKGEAGGVARPRQLRAPSRRARRRPRRRPQRRTAAGALPAAPLLADAPPRARLRRGARRRGRGLRDRDLSGPRGAAARRDGPADRRRARAAPARACASAGRPRSRTPPALVAGWARPGDTVLTLGAGDVDRAAPLILEALA